MTEAFLEQETQDRFVPTGHTQGPWEPGFQHGGPPAALLGRKCVSISRVETLTETEIRTVFSAHGPAGERRAAALTALRTIVLNDGPEGP